MKKALHLRMATMKRLPLLPQFIWGVHPPLRGPRQGRPFPPFLPLCPLHLLSTFHSLPRLHLLIILNAPRLRSNQVLCSNIWPQLASVPLLGPQTPERTSDARPPILSLPRPPLFLRLYVLFRPRSRFILSFQAFTSAFRSSLLCLRRTFTFLCLYLSFLLPSLSPSGCTLNPPRGVFDLYTPRLVRGSGHTKVGLCPICSCLGQGKVWLSTKFSAYKWCVLYLSMRSYPYITHSVLPSLMSAF
jgi:hypothetical protein